MRNVMFLIFFVPKSDHFKQVKQKTITQKLPFSITYLKPKSNNKESYTQQDRK